MTPEQRELVDAKLYTRTGEAQASLAAPPVSRPHPWKSAGLNYLKLKEAKRIAKLRRMNKRNAESRDFARMIWRTAKHRQRHPEEPNEQRRSANDQGEPQPAHRGQPN